MTKCMLRQQAIALKAQGLSPKEVAAAMGMTWERFKLVFTLKRLPMDEDGWLLSYEGEKPPLPLEQIVSVLERHTSIADAARELRMSRSILTKCMEYYGETATSFMPENPYRSHSDNGGIPGPLVSLGAMAKVYAGRRYSSVREPRERCFDATRMRPGIPITVAGNSSAWMA